MIIERYEIKIHGIVQGVGFRPFIYNLAGSLSLKGWISNTSDGVIIDVEGHKPELDVFIDRIRKEAPPLSNIKDISVKSKQTVNYSAFEIKTSFPGERKDIFISPDVSVCEDCKRELNDKSNRRYMYPFINCTNCGPRFTIIENVPYDRINTTMKKFGMCSKCEAEYLDPANRRYHAQPVSCFECGPELELTDAERNIIKCNNVIEHAKQLIKEGYIIAVKGLGGYHLFCDASNREAVLKLRKRKIRDDKPFALMVKDVDTALKYCHINEAEKELLESRKRPIVLLQKKDDFLLPDEIAPSNPSLGIMLPYTPVHILLFDYQEPGTVQSPEALVATSGNRSSEPIYFREEDAFENLAGIADYFLINNRDIHIRTDDSVTRVFRNKEYLIRRSRGYVPSPVTCDIDELFGGREIPSVLACGGELKNTFCLNKGKEFYLSHHIGDLENAETLLSFENGIDHFRRLFNISPEIVAFDLHPEYLSAKYAQELDLPKLQIQHHHAHIASCMAENNLDGEVIGVAFDGTGYGEDGRIWGGEFFSGGYKGFKRQGHLEYVKMPGGEKAIREPWRMAVSYVYETMGKNIKEIAGILKNIPTKNIELVIELLEKGINSPYTSSIGRLFDAVSSLLGIRDVINYEGQAAIELEYISDPDISDPYSFMLRDQTDSFEISASEIVKNIINDIKNGTPKEIVSGKFHETIACMVLKGCSHIREKTGLDRAALSGGVFQNITLLEKSVTKLERAGFKVFIHSKVPSNDAGISLGQAVIAAVKAGKV